MSETKKTSKELRTTKEILQEKADLIDKEKKKSQRMRDSFSKQQADIEAQSSKLRHQIAILEGEERELKIIEDLENREEELKGRIAQAEYLKEKLPTNKYVQSQTKHFFNTVKTYEESREHLNLNEKMNFMGKNIGRTFNALLDRVRESIDKISLMIRIDMLENRIKKLEDK